MHRLLEKLFDWYIVTYMPTLVRNGYIYLHIAYQPESIPLNYSPVPELIEEALWMYRTKIIRKYTKQTVYNKFDLKLYCYFETKAIVPVYYIAVPLNAVLIDERYIKLDDLIFQLQTVLSSCGFRLHDDKWNNYANQADFINYLENALKLKNNSSKSNP